MKAGTEIDAAVTWIMIIAIFVGIYFLDRAFQ